MAISVLIVWMGTDLCYQRAVCGLAPDAPKPESVACLNIVLSIHAQFPFRPWPNRLHSVAKRSRIHAQRRVLASLQQRSGVNSRLFWRQPRRVLTPTRRAGHRRNLLGHRRNLLGHRRIQGWPHDRSLLDRRRKESRHASERFCPLERKVRGAFPSCRGPPPAQRRPVAVWARIPSPTLRHYRFFTGRRRSRRGGRPEASLRAP